MNDEKQLPLIKRFMLRVAPQVVHYELSGIVDPSDFSGLHDRIASQTLGIAMHLAASYARCYDSLHSETDPVKADQQAAARRAKDLRQTADTIPEG
jgi:hypothetical protein